MVMNVSMKNQSKRCGMKRTVYGINENKKDMKLIQNPGFTRYRLSYQAAKQGIIAFKSKLVSMFLYTQAILMPQGDKRKKTVPMIMMLLIIQPILVQKDLISKLHFWKL